LRSDPAGYGLAVPDRNPGIDHDSDVPVYLQLAGILRSQIESGELAPRRPLPSIRTLQQRYGVADGTAKKAVGILRGEGLVRTVTGKGVYVVERN
jgi:GntR family transcriptional regulator